MHRLGSALAREGIAVSIAGAMFCVLVGAACGSSDDPRAPPAPECVEAGCNPRPGGGGPGGGGTTDSGVADGPRIADVGDGSIVTVDVSYTVRQTVDSWFYAVGSYGNVVTVSALSGSGWLTPLDKDAGIPTPGTLTNVAAGANWFLVEDGSNARRIASTLQLVDIDVTRADANLRAITTDALTNLVVDQVLWAPPAGTATLILNFRRAGRGAAGVTVKRDALPAGTTVAYDSSGMYVSDAMVIGTVPATDVQGTAIVREIAGTQPFPALTSATLRYSIANSTASFPPIEAKLARDTVTWMQIDLP
ncbi:MAG: hypothetical protein ABW133_16850 [Polyangiaceae bacterium]